MESPRLGKIIAADDFCERDAIHVAVYPMTAQSILLPGQRINAQGLPLEKFVGIVDPFLDRVVQIGERFWMFLFPATVTGMRHEWIHPEFPSAKANGSIEPTKSTVKSAVQHRFDSEAWLSGLAATMGMSVNELIDAARRYVLHGDYTVEHGSQNWRDTFYGNEKEFWHHVEILAGIHANDRDANPFCCTC